MATHWRGIDNEVWLIVGGDTPSFVNTKGLENSCCPTHFRYLYAQLIHSTRCLKIGYQ